jgi:hypothetical protein
MAYTNPWVETNPVDTSPANQFGDAIRDLKTDTHERLFLSGTFANRPTPEAIFVGMIYFSTDTGQLFRWSGTGWVIVSVHRRVVDSTTVTLVPIDANGIQPGNFLSLGPQPLFSVIHVSARCRMAGGYQPAGHQGVAIQIAAPVLGNTTGIFTCPTWVTPIGDGVVTISADIFVRLISGTSSELIVSGAFVYNPAFTLGTPMCAPIGDVTIGFAFDASTGIDIRTGFKGNTGGGPPSGTLYFEGLTAIINY